MATDLKRVGEFNSARLRLGRLRPIDAEQLSTLTDDRLITDAIHFLRHPFTVSDAESLIEKAGNERERFLGIWQINDGQLIGIVGAELCSGPQVEVGYWIGRAFQGQRYATEAAAALIEVLRRTFPERQAIAECGRENTASWRVLEKLGFSPTGQAGTRPGRQLLILRL